MASGATFVVAIQLFDLAGDPTQALSGLLGLRRNAR